jgi:hypothetical protein
MDSGTTSNSDTSLMTAIRVLEAAHELRNGRAEQPILAAIDWQTVQREE